MAGLSSTVPRPLDSFIGRAEELEAVNALLATHRLVTLTGPAGIGKTRLALRLGEELADSYADGVCFVGLVELTDPALVPQAVAAALGLREQPDRSLVQTLTEFLADRFLLLVWDNCDYLVDGCRALAQALLGACPRVQILATSRRSLRVRGEALYTMPPFSIPEIDGNGAGEEDPVERILAFEAPRLFEERRWYRYHRLFADVLRARLLPENAEPPAVPHARAATWYEAEGMVDEAIEHALTGGQFERAASLIERHAEAGSIIARLEPLLETWTKHGGDSGGLGARVLLAKQYWQADAASMPSRC